MESLWVLLDWRLWIAGLAIGAATVLGFIGLDKFDWSASNSPISKLALKIPGVVAGLMVVALQWRAGLPLMSILPLLLGIYAAYAIFDLLELVLAYRFGVALTRGVKEQLEKWGEE